MGQPTLKMKIKIGSAMAAMMSTVSMVTPPRSSPCKRASIVLNFESR
jgi:hypothetical protein